MKFGVRTVATLKSKTNLIKLSACGLLSALLVACGGGLSGTESAPENPDGGDNPVVVTAPGGLYVGYYKEDAGTNPEDPMPGALYLNLPASDSEFSGQMSFTYVGCQSFNVGTISGNKSSLDLSGTWTGSVDGLAQDGKFVGRFNTDKKAYQGTYNNSKGKQFVKIKDCIEYYIGPNGRWELFPVGTTVAADATPSTEATGVIIEGDKITWFPPAGGSADSLVSITDASIAASGGANAIIWQNLYNAGISTATLPPEVVLQSGQQYVLSAGAIGDSNLEYFSSRQFSAP